VENAINAVDRGFIKDGIVSDPNVVGQALDHDLSVHSRFDRGLVRAKGEGSTSDHH